jgi:hypothetical protein
MLPKVKHPSFETEVPSTKAKITYRPMLGREEKILLMAKESTIDAEIVAAVKQVVQNCVVDNTDIDTLATFDVDFLFIKIRAVSIGSTVNISHTDEVSKEVRNFVVNLNDVKITEVPEGVSNQIKIADGITATLRYPRAAIYSQPEVIAVQGMEGTDRLMAHCLDKIYEGTKMHDPRESSFEEIVEFLDGLTVDAINQFRKFLDSIPHLTYSIEFKDSQERDRKIELRTLFDFFQF